MFKRWRIKIKFLFCKLFGKYYIASKCGHETKSMAKVNIFGKEFTIIVHNPKKAEYCSSCLAKMSIRCAWCGEFILVDDPITLYTPVKKTFQIPDYAVKYSENPLQLVGCLGWKCAESGIDRAGFWVGP